LKENSVIHSFGADVPAFQGHLTWLKFLRENGACFDYVIISMARRGGHVNVLEYLLTETDCQITVKDITVSAVAHEHIHVLEWLEQNKLLDPKVLYNRIEGNDLKVLKWAIAKGIPNLKNTCDEICTK
jgi:hypothetical protein